MKATNYLIISAVFLGLNFHLAKIILKEVDFLEAGFWRFLFGVLTLIVFGFKNLPKFKIIRLNLKGILLTGFIGLFGFNFFFFLGLLHTSALNAALIVSLNPALTIVFSKLILKTSIEKIQIIGIIIALFGVTYLILKGNIINLIDIQFNSGDILILIANVFFALHHVWVRKYNSTISNLNFTFLTSLCCLIGFIFLLPINGVPKVTVYTSNFWLAAIGIGILGTALAYFLWQKGVQIKGADKAGVFTNIIPLSTALFAVVFGENLHQFHLIGGLCIGFGLLISKKTSSKLSKALS
ncbi:DMT family transporter [Kordia sp. YSTF-M3]|uniref:DMT family transporter n=1 Tax=Kordia aestuariivivens TaxID=2759037 RepID=A0ABR7QBM2_9FLAO|nr:DMT family transporter [Kordia aestuariivivens]MBC8755960.1 DMT family transporter [Kordia aestuariivivens]